MSLLTRASSAVFGEPINLPSPLPPDTLPSGVTLRRGRLIPWIGGLFTPARRPAAAVTLRGTIIVNPSARLTPELLEHELAHVRQWRADPLFPLRYTLAAVRNGYYDNPYEIEARTAAASFAPPTHPESS